MEHEQDFSALRNLLALRKLDVPMDTEINRFLIEFHRRQRAQLLVPQSRWARAVAWLQERAAEHRLLPSLSYASGLAALALVAFLGLSQQMDVASDDGSYKLSLHLPAETSLAMVPASFVRATSASPAKTDNLIFTPTAAKPGATHFILANTRVAYDATAAF